jgi:hypothetical protein
MKKVTTSNCEEHDVMEREGPNFLIDLEAG